MKTIDAATGHWPQILTEIGGIDASYLDGAHHKCPKSGAGRDRFRFADQGGRGSYFCSCSRGLGGMDLLKCCTGREFGDLAKDIDKLIGHLPTMPERKHLYIDDLRKIATKATRSKYLESRGLEVAPGLRFAKDVNYWNHDGELVGKFDAMLAPVTRDGKFITYHVTYLKDGKKAPVDPSRKVLPGHSKINGGGIELYPAAEDMGVAEGVETAIAAKIVSAMPVHAALSTSGMANWKPPAIAKNVTVFADNDANAAGLAAAWTLVHRLRLAGLKADVCLPERENSDFNDFLLETGGK